MPGPTLLEYARALVSAGHGDSTNHALRSRYLQTVARAYQANWSYEDVAAGLRIEPREVSRIVNGVQRPSTLIDVSDEVCTFCGKRRGDVPRLINGPGVYICGDCVVSARSTLDKQDSESAGGGWQKRPLSRNGACDFCGRFGRSECAVVAAAVAHICQRCVAAAVNELEGS